MLTVDGTTYHGLDEGSLLQDLLENLILIGGTKLVLELALAGLVELALCTVTTGGEDVVGLKDLRQRRGRILLILLVVLWLGDKDDEAFEKWLATGSRCRSFVNSLFLALVVNAALESLSLHVCGCVFKN